MSELSSHRGLNCMIESASVAARLDDLIAIAPAGLKSWYADAGGHPDLLVALGDESERLALVDAARAQVAAKAVVALADACGGPRERARARRAAAQAAAYSGHHEEALALCEDAYQLAIDDAPIEAGRALSTSLHPLGELARYDEAEVNGERARALLFEAGETKLAARADINLGVIASNRDQPERALFFLDRAAPHFSGEPLMSGYIQNNRGEALLALAQFKGAECAFAAALSACEAAGAELAAAIAEGNLADLAARRGRLDEAARRFETARERMRSTGADSHAARLLGEEAEALLALGQMGRAAETARLAIDQLESHGLQWDAARARVCQARAVARLGDAEAAGVLLRDACEAFERVGHALDAAAASLALASIALESGDRESARATLEAARPQLERRPYNHTLALVLQARLRTDHDLADADHAVEAAFQLDVPPIMAAALATRGRARAAVGDCAGALADLRVAVDQIERVRGALPAEAFRASLQSDHSELYADFVSATLAQAAPDPESILYAIELRRSRLLADALRQRQIDPQVVSSDPETTKLIARRKRVGEELRALYSRLADAGLGGARPPNLDRWRRQASEREHETKEVESRLALRSGAAGFGGFPTLAEAQQSLDDGTCLVCFGEAGNDVFALVIDRKSAHLAERLATVEDVTEAVRRAHFQISRAARLSAGESVRMLADTRRSLGRLNELIMAPVREVCGAATRLIVVPSGALQAAPLHAAWDGAQYAMEGIDIGYAPSVAAWTAIRNQPRGPAGGAVVVSVANEAAPNIALEGRMVAAALNAELFVDGEATAEMVGRILRSARVAHFACHGWFSPDMPHGSGLRLGDRWFTLRDIYQTQTHADLVTLSACDTGRSARDGEEFIGALSAFLRVGARSVLASLWPAADASTATLMGEFYESWGERPGPGKLGALCAAQRRMMRRTPHPFFWAAFVLVGEP